ncbi:MAG: hypothetical protein R3F61_01560 [Myxococcota bacterium]
MVVVHGRGHARVDCMAAEAVRDDGLRAIRRVHWPDGTTPASVEHGPITLLQDHLAITEPGTWRVRFRAGCDPDDPWTALVLDVTPAVGVPLDEALAHPTVAALPANLEALVERTRTGDARAARALAAIPTPAATDALLALRSGAGIPSGDASFVVATEILTRQPDPRRPYALEWSHATWTAAHSRHEGLPPDHDPGVRAVPLVDARADEPAAGSTLEGFALDEPIFVDTRLSEDRMPSCLEIRATGPGGDALQRPDRPRASGTSSRHWNEGSRVVLQDFVVVDTPGPWEIRLATVGCFDGAYEWRVARIQVDPPRFDRSTWDPHPYYASPVALPEYRKDLERLAHQGVEWAVRGIGAIPDPTAIASLLRLREHPRDDVRDAAVRALSYRIPRDGAEPSEWSRRTWRADLEKLR